MTQKVNNSMEHANSTNPCEGYCQSEDGVCLACFRTDDERIKWYMESDDWREIVLEKIKVRKENLFDEQ
jgi:predicted Fe-S protein YdhL (DUF1289 family)